MCGRFTQTFAWDQANMLPDLAGLPLSLQPRCDMAPSQEAAVVRADREGRRRLSMLCWGLISAWAKNPRIGHKLINARAETARIKPSFRAAFASRRCLISADGFYKWKREPKQPCLIGMKDRGPFAFASLWECWTAREGVEPTSAPVATLPTVASSRAASQYDYIGSFREAITREVQLRDAKASLSALVEKAAHGEAAVITRRGKPRAVIMRIEEWNRLRDVPSFGRLLLSAPLEDADLPPHDTTPMHDAVL